MMNENNADDLLGAITGALDNPPEGGEKDLGEEAPEETVEVEEPVGEADAGEEPEGEEEAEGEEAEEEDEGEEGEEEAEGEIDPKTGKPKAPAKAADPLNDPLPKGTLQRTNERFAEIREIVKTERAARAQVEEQLTTVTEQHNELVGMITGAGLDATRFNTMVNYASLFNSPVFEDRQKAYKFLVGELTALAKDLGETPPGVHPLTGHDDLIAEVRANPPTLTMQRAIEMAQQRNRSTAAEAHRTKHGAQLQERQASETARTAAQAELKTLGQTLAKTDGAAEFSRKANIVLKEMRDEIMALPPARWATAFKKAYNLVPKAAPAPKPKPKVQPLRGKSPAGGGGTKQPKTLKEAIFGSFDKS